MDDTDYADSESVHGGQSSPLDVSETEVQKWTPQLTKIVATIGPTSEQFHVLQKLVRCGLRVMRLNFSHATVEEVELRCKNLDMCKGRHGVALSERMSTRQNLRAVLLDTRGPEIRSGKLRNDYSGKETINLEQGKTITLRTSTHWEEMGSTEKDLFIDYAKLTKCLKPGMKVLLDDGAVVLTVLETNEIGLDGPSVVCRIDNSGELRSRAGVNLPGAVTDLPAITDKDKNDIKYGLTKDIDYIAASFVQNAEGVREIRQFVRHVMTYDMGMDPSAPAPLIISKIESVAALRNFDEILIESDGIMVARGDLGVEIPIQQVTNAQKEIIAACNAVGKPVIVATQMLESMAKNPRPTRAEVADVTNAVYDGADCVMLSGETAKGKYPVETVKMMNEIILGAERFATLKPELSGGGMHGSTWWMRRNKNNLYKLVDSTREFRNRSSLSAVAMSAVMSAEARRATAIIVLTLKGYLPKLISAYRPNVPIVAFCPHEKMARQLMIHRGIHPVMMLPGTSNSKKPLVAIKDAMSLGLVEKGDEVIVVAVETCDVVGNYASMKVVVVPEFAKPQIKEPVRKQIHPGCV
jgi:pyruvate kinase